MVITLTVAIAVLVAILWLGRYRINLTPSAPVGLWWIEPLAEPLAYGDLVFICPPPDNRFRLARERGYLGYGLCEGWYAPLIKRVAALAGDTIVVGKEVTINGVLLPHSHVRYTDAEGRPLAPWPGGCVPEAQAYLHSEFPGSYDSRYTGPLPLNGLLGRARPIWVFHE